MNDHATAATIGEWRLEQPATKPPPWHSLVSADLFLSGLAAGLFVIAAIGDLVAPEVYAAAATVGYFIALPAAGLDLICLVLDLGDPLRFHHMLRMVKPRSPMSAGVWGLSALALFCAINALLSILILAGGGGAHVARQLIGAIGVAPALFAGAYKGVLLSATAQPGWKDARWLGAQLSISSLALGVAAMLLVALFLPVAQAVHSFRLLLIVLLALELVVSAVVMVELRHEWGRRAGAGSKMLAALLRIRVDLIISLILAAAVASLAGLTASSIFVLFGALAFRHHLVMIPHGAG